MFIPYFSGFVALICCVGALPLVRRLALSFSLYDAPGPLKIHKGSVPRLGGIAMLAGFLAGSLTLYLVAPRLSLLPLLVFSAVWVVGVIDDLRSLGSIFRFAVHIAAGCALWFAGWRLEWFSSRALDLVATCLFVALIINAMNLLDGMDGLAAGITCVVCMGLIMISTGTANVVGFTVAASLLGASAGMLTLNAPPAKMFMGDSGSTLIGIVLAFLSLNWIRTESGPQNLLVPLIFLSVPLADAAFAILRRARSHKSLFEGDRRHFYDLLLQRGWTVKSVLRISIGVTAILVFAGLLCARGIVGSWLTAILALCGLAAAAHSLGSLQSESSPVPPSQQEHSLGSALE